MTIRSTCESSDSSKMEAQRSYWESTRHRKWKLKLVPGEVVTEVERSLKTKLNEAIRKIDEITDDSKVQCMADKVKHERRSRSSIQERKG